MFKFLLFWIHDIFFISLRTAFPERPEDKLDKLIQQIQNKEGKIGERELVKKLLETYIYLT